MIQYNHMVTKKKDTRPGRVGLGRKPKDLSASESEEHRHGEGRDVYVRYYSQIQYRHMLFYY